MDRGCLSADEIQRMISEAEKYKDEDKQKESFLAKNSQENFPFGINSRTEDDEVNKQEHEDIISKYKELFIDSKLYRGIAPD